VEELRGATGWQWTLAPALVEQIRQFSILYWDLAQGIEAIFEHATLIAPDTT
jgi:hypothetical protein